MANTTTVNNVAVKKASLDDVKCKKIYLDDVKVFSSGNVVTYYVNINDIHQEEVDGDDTVLKPKTFTPAISGWQFVGWREDKAANASVLTSKTMGEDPISLYAVFKRSLSLSYESNYATGGSTATQWVTQYYNNGTWNNPVVYLSSCGYTYNDAAFQRWALGSPGTAVTLTQNTSTRAQIKYNDMVPNVNQYWGAGTLRGGQGNNNLWTIDGTKYSSIYIANLNLIRASIWIDNGSGPTWAPSNARYCWAPSDLTKYNLLYQAFSARYDGYNKKYINGVSHSDGGETLVIAPLSISIPATSVHLYLNDHDEDYGAGVATGVKYIGRTLT